VIGLPILHVCMPSVEETVEEGNPDGFSGANR
jgi:hypothetical protein